MKYKIALGRDPGRVETKTLEWDAIADRLSRHEVSLTKAGSYFVGGAFSSSERVETNLLCRSMLTLDIDDVDMSINDLEFAITMGIDCAFVAYSTFSHTPDAPKIRVIVPLSRDVTPDEYREVSRRFADDLGLKLDPCSFTPNQFMYLPRCPDQSLAWSVIQHGEPHQVPSDLPVVERGVVNDLEEAINSQPLDLSDDEVDAYLAAYDPEVLEYDMWLSAGAALHHQYRGSDDEGYSRWLTWSERSAKHDPKLMPMKWRSFGKSVRKITFASIIWHVRESGSSVVVKDGDDTGTVEVISGDKVEAAAFERLADDAAGIADMDAYDGFKKRLQRMSLTVLPLDKRSMLAQEVYDAWGKNEGLTKADIKRELKPTRKEQGLTKSKKPEWLRGWIYIEKTCEFYHIDLHYAIKREAFDAKYSREDECVIAEMQASRLALVEYGIDTVVDLMFWPGAEQLYKYEGKQMLNSYRESGIVPCDEIDADGQSVIDMFMQHVAFTLDDERERRILIDFMAWVVQHPGQKINWALLLQGAQGVGKSYFGVVMMLVLGEMARNVEPSALAGRFTSWAHGSTLVIVEEIRVVSENRFEIIDRLKPFISNATIQIEEKGRDHRTVPNFSSYMMFTNHKDALPLGAGDRRYAPLFSRVQSEEQLFAELGGEIAAGDYFTKLFDESQRRADALSRMLRNWKISDEFNAKGRAPHTAARDEMMQFAISPERSMIEDMIDKHACDIIGPKIIDVTWLNKLCEGEGDVLPKTRAMSAILMEMGYKQIASRRVKISKTKNKHYVWHRDCDEDSVRVAVRDFHGDKIDDQNDPNWCPF